MENGVRAACFAVRVRKDVELGARVEHRKHIKFIAARRSREARARSIVDCAPEALGDAILATVILTTRSYLNPVRAVTRDSSLLAGLRMQHVLIVGMKPQHVNTGGSALPKHFGERGGRLRFVLETDEEAEGGVVADGAKEVFIATAHGGDVEGP